MRIEEYITEMARVGARARLAELKAEFHTIGKHFPELLTDADGRQLLTPARPNKQHAKPAVAAKGNGHAKRAARAPMTKAQRKAVSRRMKKFWAGRRAEQ